MKISSLIACQVFSIYEGEFVGTIHSVAFDNTYKKIKGVYFFDNDENEYFISVNNINSFCDVVTIKNKTKIQSTNLFNHNFSPIGKNVVSLIGQAFGILCDVELENFETQFFLTSTNKKISFEDIAWIDNSVIVGKVKKYTFKPKQSVEKTSSIVRIMQMENSNEQIQLNPNKVTINTLSLVGKKVRNNVFGKNNELIIKQSSVIAPKHIELAKMHGKTNELFYSAI